MFPAESVPDGAVFAPHHFLYPLYAIFLIYIIRLNNNPDSDPVLIPLGTAVALIGWFHFWNFYPVTGALLALIGVVAVIIGGIIHTNVPTHWRISVAVLGVFALDDWLSHALGVKTPTDILFQEYVVHLMV